MRDVGTESRKKNRNTTQSSPAKSFGNSPITATNHQLLRLSVNLVGGQALWWRLCISQGFDTQGFLQVARGLDYSLLWKICPH
jgi:hypothetical protein